MKKTIKICGALLGMGVVASGTSMSLTGCGNNDPLKVIVEGQSINTISIADDAVNKIETLLLNISIVSEKTGRYCPVTGLHEIISSRIGEETKKIYATEELTSEKNSIVFKIGEIFEYPMDKGTWNIMIYAKNLKPWMFPIEIVE